MDPSPQFKLTLTEIPVSPDGEHVLFNLYFLFHVFGFVTLLSQGFKKTVYRLIECSSPRKSLVKGERFIRGLKRNQSEIELLVEMYK